MVEVLEAMEVMEVWHFELAVVVVVALQPFDVGELPHLHILQLELACEMDFAWLENLAVK